MKLSGIINEKRMTPQSAALFWWRIKQANGDAELVPEYDGEITAPLAVAMSKACGGLPTPAYWMALQYSYDEANR